MKSFKASAFALLAVAAIAGFVWAFNEPAKSTESQVAAENASCCVTGNCCCPGAGSCCDTTKRVKSDNPVATKTAGCCGTGNCCCPGAGSCCAKAEKKSCCSTP